MKIRDRKPEAGNKFYNTVANGGLSTCIKGYPIDKDCDVLSNCVGYACGRFNEIIGHMDYPYLNCNAENFIERAKEYGLEISTVPTLGGIMVFQKGNTLHGGDGAGHVFIVEKLLSEDEIVTSESAYRGKAFYTRIRKNFKNKWQVGDDYYFRGCIINPAIGRVVFEKPKNVYIVKPGDTLSGIASIYNTTYQELARINNIENPNLIYPGQEIRLITKVIHVVETGETLSGIASKYNTTYQELARINNIENPNLIYPGQEIVIR